MELKEILLPALSFIGGGGLISLVTARSTRRLKGSEADSAAVNALNEALALVTKVEQENQELRKTIVERDNEIIKLKNECATKGWFLCSHLGCACRKPKVGAGKMYFEQHKNEDDCGADYLSIEDLISQYKRKRYDWGQKPPKSLEESKREFNNRNNFNTEDNDGSNVPQLPILADG